MEENASQRDIDVSRLLVCGASGAAPMTVGAMLFSIKDQKPFPSAVMLLAPVLDDRPGSVFKSICRRRSLVRSLNQMAWDHVLGTQRG